VSSNIINVDKETRFACT